MNPVKWRYLSVIFLCISLVFLGATIALPLVKSPQEAVYRGPAVHYVPGVNTTLSGYYIPTVDQGSMVRVSFSNFIPGSVEVSIFPTTVGSIAPSGADPVFIQQLFINQSIYFRADATQPYGIYVISHNQTTFLMRVEATYSPYDWLRPYNFAGISASFASAILLYYYTFTSKRWAREQQALREATGDAEQ